MDFNVIKHNTTPTLVSQVLLLELVDPSGAVAPLETELSYDPADPLAVSAIFSTVAGRVRWTFGRDLLIEGLVEPVGDGDVHVWPCVDNDGNSVVIIELCSPDGEALVQARTGDLHTFVDRMGKAVQPGSESEHIDIDAAITAIFAAEAA